MVQSEWPLMGNCQHQSDIPALAASDPPHITCCRGREVGGYKGQGPAGTKQNFLP